MDEELKEEKETETDKPGESKHDKFKRLASGRTNKVLTALAHLGNCSSKGSYEYTDEEVEKIFTAIQNKLDETKAKFYPEEKKEKEEFSL